MPCAKTKRGPRPRRCWCLSASWVCVHLPLLLADGVNINRERTWEGPQNKKWKGFLNSYKEAPWRGGGGEAFVLMDKKKEGVRVCKGIRRRGANVFGENARAAYSICAEAGGRGFNALRAAWTEDQLSLCSRLGSTSLRPRRRCRKNKLEIWWMCSLTNCFIWITLCGFHLKGILILNIFFAVFPKILTTLKRNSQILWLNYSARPHTTTAVNPVHISVRRNHVAVC